MFTKRCLTCISASSRVAASRMTSVPVARRNLATAAPINGQAKFDDPKEGLSTEQSGSVEGDALKSQGQETRSANRSEVHKSKSSSTEEGIVKEQKDKEIGNKGENRTSGKKTMAQLDDELRAKMEGREGSAGIEYENGKPVTDGFKRGVRTNMFRVI
ncbi:hypothetical protein CJF32_00003004 [Rutstroemia sp. NJR-2017a WRK4]|nr:hypothetical protein CJF32_00003004 [Rutstroemia sp. NJR-2017a WRK4]